MPRDEGPHAPAPASDPPPHPAPAPTSEIGTHGLLVPRPETPESETPQSGTPAPETPGPGEEAHAFAARAAAAISAMPSPPGQSMAAEAEASGHQPHGGTRAAPSTLLAALFCAAGRGAVWEHALHAALVQATAPAAIPPASALACTCLESTAPDAPPCSGLHIWLPPATGTGTPAAGTPAAGTPAAGTGAAPSTAAAALPGADPEGDGVAVAGVRWRTRGAEWLRLACLPPPTATWRASGAVQAAALFDRWRGLLARAGFTFADVVRTWFFNDHILDWYGDFNRARDAFFREERVFERFPPASTGIGGGNRWGAALQGGLLAIRPVDPAARPFPVASPLQNPALDYGSSFSRAVGWRGPVGEHLWISGTASIDGTGRTVHLGDTAAQIETTLAVVEALLAARGFAWGDVQHGIAYLPAVAETALWRSALARHGLAALPLNLAYNEICRGDLRFELEVEAWRSTAQAEGAP